MTFNELLKVQGCTDEQITKIENAMKENKIYTTNEENIEERYSKMKGQKEDLEAQLKTASGTITTLKKDNADNEDLQKKVKTYEDDIKTLKKDSETKIKNLTLDNAIKLALKDNNAKYEDLLAGKFDRDKLTIKEDGTVEGITDQIKTLQEGYKDLFTQSVTGTTPPNNGDSTKTVDTSKMTYSEMVTYQEANPDAKLF